MLDILFWILAFFDLLVGAGWIALLLYSARELSTYHNFVLNGAPTKNDEVVSVVVPARNEEMRIVRCLGSITGQTHSNLEIIVVDDRSTDLTAQKVAAIGGSDTRVKLVRGEELPRGWVGKSWACHQGFHASKGEWLLFVDSDSVLENDAVARTLSYSKREGMEALSIFPRGEMIGFWSKMVWPFLSSVIRFLYPLSGINSPKGRSALVFGAFILIRRDAYGRIGGHEAVKADFVEDKQIGVNLKASEVRYRVLLDGSVLTAGLAGGFGGVWSSIGRIASNPLRNGKVAGLGFVVVGLMIFAYPLVALGTSSVMGYQTNPFALMAIISVLSPAAIVTYDLHNTTSRSYAYAVLAFVAGTIVMLGILRGILGGSDYAWRGRTYKMPNQEAG